MPAYQSNVIQGVSLSSSIWVTWNPASVCSEYTNWTRWAGILGHGSAHLESTTVWCEIFLCCTHSQWHYNTHCSDSLNPKPPDPLYPTILRRYTNTLLLLLQACGVSVSNAAQRIPRPRVRWKPRLLCGSHTGCLQAESVLAWLAACCHRALESRDRLRADRGTDRRFQFFTT